MSVPYATTGFMAQLRRLAFRMTGYNQYGLYHDDVLAEHHDVKEAITRLPENIRDERNFRISRALILNMKKIVLPKEEWVSYEEDQERGRYLKPFIQEVIKERLERYEWNKR